MRHYPAHLDLPVLGPLSGRILFGLFGSEASLHAHHGFVGISGAACLATGIEPLDAVKAVRTFVNNVFGRIGYHGNSGFDIPFMLIRFFFSCCAFLITGKCFNFGFCHFLLSALGLVLVFRIRRGRIGIQQLFRKRQHIFFQQACSHVG